MGRVHKHGLRWRITKRARAMPRSGRDSREPGEALEPPLPPCAAVPWEPCLDPASQGSLRDDNRSNRRLRPASCRHPACAGAGTERRGHSGDLAGTSREHARFPQSPRGAAGGGVQRRRRGRHRPAVAGDGAVHAAPGAGAVLGAGPERDGGLRARRRGRLPAQGIQPGRPGRRRQPGAGGR